MEMEKVLFFLDYGDINRVARDKRFILDYKDLLQYIGEGRFLVDAYCYVPVNPKNEHRVDKELEELWRSGYLVHTKVETLVSGRYRCNFAVEITMDVLRVVYQIKPEIIVLATSNADFIPLIQEVRKAGVRVEVAAFVETAGADLLLKCSGFINLAGYYESYLASQNSEPDENDEEKRYESLIRAQSIQLDEDDTSQGGNGKDAPIPDA